MINNQNGSIQTKSDDSNKQPLNLSQKKDFNMEDIPIYTMKEDLEFLRNPALKKNQDNQPIVKREGLTPKQKTSPFLNQKTDQPSLSINQSIKSETEKNPPKSLEERLSSVIAENNLLVKGSADKLNLKAEQEEQNLSDQIKARIGANEIKKEEKSPTLLYGLMTILVISLVSAGYYYWTINRNASEMAAEEAIPKDVPQEIPTLSYSADKANYMQLEIESSDSVAIKAELQKFMKVIKEEGYTVPVEFIITDSTNKRVSFEAFAQKIGLGLSPAATSAIGNDFSLYIFNDGAPKIGIAADLKDGEMLKKIPLDEEPNLANEINPFFYTTNYKTDKLFADSEYKGAKIRYQNIIAPEVLSVDYTVFQNKLIIGITKNTLRAIIDSLEKETTQATNMEEAVTTPTESAEKPTEVTESTKNSPEAMEATKELEQE